MQISYQWLKDYVDFDYTPEELAHELTMAGFADEGKKYLDKGISKVVTGKIISLEKHPDADRLQICQLDVGQGKNLQIVTGAQNIKEGDLVPVALVGSELPIGLKIKRSKLRGIESNGMLCSGQELDMDKKILAVDQQDGILILSQDLPLGQDIVEVMGFNDVLIDLDVTTNRPDCLSIMGIAREVAALVGKKVKLPEVEIAEDKSVGIEEMAKVTVEAPDLCPRYAARVVKDIKIKTSPLWLQRKIQAAGMRPINNIVDITNFILLELGQPLHAFDLDYLAGKEIIVRRALDGEKMVTLDEQERTLSSEMLVIGDREKAVALAGVMGGLNSEVTPETNTVLIEAANFNPISVRKTSKRLGLRSEASNRFEKGLDPNIIDLALDRAAQLMAELGEGKVVAGKLDYYPEKLQPKIITLPPERISRLLGADLKPEEIAEILTRLELEVEKEGEKFQVTIPTFRLDLVREADLLEEVARIYGYDKVEATPLAGTSMQGGKTYEHYMGEKIKELLLSSGLNEVITYSFINSKSFDLLGLPGDDLLRLAIPLANPLTEEHNVMRTTLIPSLLQVVGVNMAKQVKNVEIFELGAAYLPEKLPLEKLPYEQPTLAGAVTGRSVKNIWGTQEEIDFFYLKGILENMLENLGINDYTFTQGECSYLHPGKTAVITIMGEKAGLIGEVHPDVLESYQINQRVYVFELRLDKLLDKISLMHKYHQLPKYPSITRDLAIVLKEEIPARKVEEIIRAVGKDLIEEVTLFDVYQGEQVAVGQKSLAYSLVYRSPEKTLTDEEINPIQEQLVNRLTNELGASLRF